MTMLESHIRAIGSEAYGLGMSSDTPEGRAFFRGVEEAVRWILDGQVGSRQMSQVIGAVRAKEESGYYAATE
jgi:hypothetical protein